MPLPEPDMGRRCHRVGGGAPGGAHARAARGGGRAWKIRGAEPEEERPEPGRGMTRGVGTAPLATFRRAEGPRRPRRRWYRMQIRMLTSEIMWFLA